MLIVEGPDLVGKTTLCHHLTRLLGEHGPWLYAHFPRLPDPNWDYYRDYLPWIQPHVVMDRFYMSEIAYRYARREPMRLSPETYRRLDAHTRLVGGFTVVVHATEEWLKKAITTRQESHTPGQILRANEWFEMAARERQAEGYRVDVDMHYCIGLHGQGYPTSNPEFIRRVLDRYRERCAI